MKITEVRIFPSESRDGKLKAFATMTFDDWFVVRNVKVIQGTNGLFVAMPSRKVMDPCPKCGFKNARGSKYCNQCGKDLPPKVFPQDDDSGPEKQSGHMDIAHPVTPECRVYIQEEILRAYERDLPGKKNAGQQLERQVGNDRASEEERVPEKTTSPVQKEETDVERLVEDEEKDIAL